MTKRMYRLVNGMHYHRNPDVGNAPEDRHNPWKHLILKKGDVIESDEELDKKFLNKFELVVEAVPVVSASPARKGEVADLIAKGYLPESDRSWLEGLTDDRFERVTRGFKKEPDASGVLPKRKEK